MPPHTATLTHPQQHHAGRWARAHAASILTCSFLLALITFVGLTGCVTQPVAGEQSGSRHPTATQQGPLSVVRSTAGQSVQGRAITCSQHGAVGRCAMIMGGIHGEEPASARLVELLDAYLTANPGSVERYSVLVVPRVNPDGLEAGRRVNARGVDLNRNFPAANRKNTARHGSRGLSEPESRIIAQLIREHNPRVIVSVHQPLNCVDYDGPPEARQIAQRIAAVSGMHVNKLGARAGSLGAWAGEDMQIPIITLELPGRATSMSDEELWDRYGDAMLAACDDPRP